MRTVSFKGFQGYQRKHDIELNVCSMQHILGDASVHFTSVKLHLICVPFFFMKHFLCYSFQISHGLAENYNMFFKFGSFPKNPEEKLHLQNLTCETPQKMNDLFSMFIGSEFHVSVKNLR